jgi:GNAT superfamily N-acetyltransferase
MPAARAETAAAATPAALSTVRVEPVTTARLEHAFVELPWTIYRDDPNWVPPLKSDFRRNMSRKNPFFRYASIQHYVAFRNNEAVGRVAATVYPEYNDKYGAKTGFFGFFESVDDRAVSRALLQAASAWLWQHGMRRLSGPYNYCSTQEMGLLVEGFDAPAATFQTYNPPYYEELLRDAGLERTFVCGCYRFTASPKHAALIAAGDRICQRHGLTKRFLRKNRILEDMEIIRRVFNDSFAENDDVTPIAADVWAFQVEAVKSLLRPELITIVEKDGEPIAFALVTPNFNEALIKLNGNLFPWNIFRLPGLLRGIRSIVVPLIGAIPKWQGLGVGRVLVAEIIRSTVNYEALDTTWVHEDNWESLAIMRRSAGQCLKRYAILSRDLKGPAE